MAVMIGVLSMRYIKHEPRGATVMKHGNVRASLNHCEPLFYVRLEEEYCFIKSKKKWNKYRKNLIVMLIGFL